MVVFAQPFVEEMNKSRRMAALQARALAGQGWAVLLPDLLGCGDSPGDKGDARWTAWVDDSVALAGCAVHAQMVIGRACWQTSEIEDAPRLIEATLAALATPVPASPRVAIAA